MVVRILLTLVLGLDGVRYDWRGGLWRAGFGRSLVDVRGMGRGRCRVRKRKRIVRWEEDRVMWMLGRREVGRVGVAVVVRMRTVGDERVGFGWLVVVGVSLKGGGRRKRAAGLFRQLLGEEGETIWERRNWRLRLGIEGWGGRLVGGPVGPGMGWSMLLERRWFESVLVVETAGCMPRRFGLGQGRTGLVVLVCSLWVPLLWLWLLEGRLESRWRLAWAGSSWFAE